MAALIPPPRKHVVRYYGALGPRSPLRSAVTCATRGNATLRELEQGYSVTLVGKGWAACLRKIFEVDPVMCVKCGGEMKLVAVILDDGELDRILAHQKWAVEFAKTRRYQDFLSGVCAGPEGSRPKGSRAPPGIADRGEADSQVDPRGEKWEGRQDFGSDWPA